MSKLNELQELKKQLDQAHKAFENARKAAKVSVRKEINDRLKRAGLTLDEVFPERSESKPVAASKKPRGKRLSAQEKENIVERMRSGTPVAAIAKELGCSMPTLYNLKRKAGLAKKRAKPQG